MPQDSEEVFDIMAQLIMGIGNDSPTLPDPHEDSEEDSFIPDMIDARRLQNVIETPPESQGIFFRNIYTCRLDIRVSLAEAGMTQRGFIYLLGAMGVVKSRRRLIEGFTRLQNANRHTQVCGEVLSYLTTHTCARTREQRRGVVCAARIPDSFPELTALIFVRSARRVTAQQLVRQPWMARVHLCRAGRQRNREAFQGEWKRVNRLQWMDEEALARCENVYGMLQRDEMRLVDAQGRKVGRGEYTMQALEEYIALVRRAGTDAASQVAGNGFVRDVLRVSAERGGWVEGSGV